MKQRFWRDLRAHTMQMLPTNESEKVRGIHHLDLRRAHTHTHACPTWYLAFSALQYPLPNRFLRNNILAHTHNHQSSVTLNPTQPFTFANRCWASGSALASCGVVVKIRTTVPLRT